MQIVCFVAVLLTSLAVGTPNLAVAAPTAPPTKAAPTPQAQNEWSCSGLSCLFVDVKDIGPDFDKYNLNKNGSFYFWPFFQVCFLGIVYGFVLMKGADMISDGSELLLLVPSMEGIVGSVVLPVLGAVPDGAIVLFSGLGSKAEAAEQVAVGVGALAGSTIMLLTIPWFLSILGGRVDLKRGVPDYRRKGESGAKLTVGFSLTGSGVSNGNGVKFGGVLMLVTAISYLIIQIPASALGCSKTPPGNHESFDEKCAKQVSWYALVAFILAVICFVCYLVYQIKSTHSSGVVEEKIVRQIHQGEIGFVTAFETYMTTGKDMRQSTSVLLGDAKKEKLFRDCCRHFFREIDTDNSGDLDVYELRDIQKKLGVNISSDQFLSFLRRKNMDQKSTISFDEFCVAMKEMMKTPPVEFSKSQLSLNRQDSQASKTYSGLSDDEEDEEDSDVESPEDILALPKEKQMRAIIMKSCKLMGLGSVLVLLFSDPMVDLLNNLGDRTGIPAFYISFILAPLASNAAEVVAAYNYASKRTKKSITISFQTLQGACCMNNTFCLSIFLALIYFRDFAWEYTAETISIVFVEVVMAFISFKSSASLLTGFLVLSLYPISLLIVAVLESTALGLN